MSKTLTGHIPGFACPKHFRIINSQKIRFGEAAATVGTNHGGSSGGAGTPRGRKPKKDIRSNTKGLNSGWFLKAEMLCGLLELITITTSSGVEDAYFNPLVVALDTPNSDPNNIPEILLQGLMGAFFMRISLTNTGRLMTIKKGAIGQYQRKAFIRVVDEGEDTPSSRLTSLNVIKAFLEEERNNQYSTKVHIQEPGWDLTNTPLRKLDNYLEYGGIVKIVKELFVNVDGNWAVNNMESAMCFFTAGHIPLAAHADLGFPLEHSMGMPHNMPAGINPGVVQVKFSAVEGGGNVAVVDGGIGNDGIALPVAMVAIADGAVGGGSVDGVANVTGVGRTDRPHVNDGADAAGAVGAVGTGPAGASNGDGFDGVGSNAGVNIVGIGADGITFVGEKRCLKRYRAA
jgi:hypothetical protein